MFSVSNERNEEHLREDTCVNRKVSTQQPKKEKSKRAWDKRGWEEGGNDVQRVSRVSLGNAMISPGLKQMEKS